MAEVARRIHFSRVSGAVFHASRNRAVSGIPVVAPLFTEWLPASGETLGDFPLFFHYVNVGPDVAEHEMITDVYLPLR